MRHGDTFPILLVGLLLVLCGVACTRSEEIHSGVNVMFFDAGGEIFVAEGRWLRVGQERTLLIPDVNSVRIECHRTQGFCDEYIAKFITPADDEMKLTRGNHLFLMKQTFRITEWNQERISASADPRAADLSLRVSFRDGVAERSARSTPARGAEVEDPSVIYHWVLKARKLPDPTG